MCKVHNVGLRYIKFGIFLGYRIVADPGHFGGYGSGSAVRASDQWIRILTFKTLQKTIFIQVFLLITFLRYIYIIFQIQKVIKKSQNSRNQGFSYYFCLLIEGSGSVPLTNGSRSRSGSGSATLPPGISYRHKRIAAERSGDGSGEIYRIRTSD